MPHYSITHHSSFSLFFEEFPKIFCNKGASTPSGFNATLKKKCIIDLQVLPTNTNFLSKPYLQIPLMTRICEMLILARKLLQHPRRSKYLTWPENCQQPPRRQLLLHDPYVSQHRRLPPPILLQLEPNSHGVHFTPSTFDAHRTTTKLQDRHSPTRRIMGFERLGGTDPCVSSGRSVKFQRGEREKLGQVSAFLPCCFSLFNSIIKYQR